MSMPTSAPRTAAALAARNRDTQAALGRVHDTITRLRREKTPVSVAAVARRAGVSRSWIYTQTDVKDEIRRLRGQGRHQPTAPTPAQQRASDDSLRQRLELANRRNHELADENQRLRRQLTHALGQLRDNGSSRPAEPRADHRNSITIGPC